MMTFGASSSQAKCAQLQAELSQMKDERDRAAVSSYCYRGTLGEGQQLTLE